MGCVQECEVGAGVLDREQGRVRCAAGLGFVSMEGGFLLRDTPTLVVCVRGALPGGVVRDERHL